MSKELLSEYEDGTPYSLTRFFGGSGIMYQITQRNEVEKRYMYVQLSKDDLLRVLGAIVENEQNIDGD